MFQFSSDHYCISIKVSLLSLCLTKPNIISMREGRYTLLNTPSIHTTLLHIQLLYCYTYLLLRLLLCILSLSDICVVCGSSSYLYLVGWPDFYTYEYVLKVRCCSNSRLSETFSFLGTAIHKKL